MGPRLPVTIVVLVNGRRNRVESCSGGRAGLSWRETPRLVIRRARATRSSPGTGARITRAEPPSVSKKARPGGLTGPTLLEAAGIVDREGRVWRWGEDALECRKHHDYPYGRPARDPEGHAVSEVGGTRS